jgi:adenosine deaminase
MDDHVHPHRPRLMTMSASREFAHALPKVSLHLHLEGAVRAATFIDLAERHGVPVPGGRGVDSVYDIDAYADLGEFMQTYDIVGSVIRDADDFHRVTYESLADGAAHGVMYREMFVSPQSHEGVGYEVLLDGITAGIRDAERDHGIGCRLIVAANREKGPIAARQLVETVIEHRTDDVVGVGLDYDETVAPPELFAEAFALAGRSGLRRTAHSESGPPANIETLIDVLGVDRVDHGYHVATDERVVQRCRDLALPFTCTPVTSDITGASGSGDGTHRTIGDMVDAGLIVTIDSDDPPMFGTDPTNDFAVLADALGYDERQLSRFTANAIDASWLDATEKTDLHRSLDVFLAEQSARTGSAG